MSSTTEPLSEFRSLLLLLLSTVLFSIMSCFLQISTRTDGIPSSELVLFKSVFQGTLVVAAMAVCSENGDIGNREDPLIRRPFGGGKTAGSGSSSSFSVVQKLVFARGIVGGIGMLLYYYTMAVLPLGDAVTLLSLSPVITVLAGHVFLREPIRTEIGRAHV